MRIADDQPVDDLVPFDSLVVTRLLDGAPLWTQTVRTETWVRFQVCSPGNARVATKVQRVPDPPQVEQFTSPSP